MNPVTQSLDASDACCGSIMVSIALLFYDGDNTVIAITIQHSCVCRHGSLLTVLGHIPTKSPRILDPNTATKNMHHSSLRSTEGTHQQTPAQRLHLSGCSLLTGFSRVVSEAMTQSHLLLMEHWTSHTHSLRSEINQKVEEKED